MKDGERVGGVEGYCSSSLARSNKVSKAREIARNVGCIKGRVAEKVERTEITNHGRVPRLRFAASCAMRAYTSCMTFGAGQGPDLANGALMSALSAGDSFVLAMPASFASADALLLLLLLWGRGAVFLDICVKESEFQPFLYSSFRI